MSGRDGKRTRFLKEFWESWPTEKPISGLNNVIFKIWHPEYAHWKPMYGLFRGLPKIPNRTCPNYDKRKGQLL